MHTHLCVFFWKLFKSATPQKTSVMTLYFLPALSPSLNVSFVATVLAVYAVVTPGRKSFSPVRHLLTAALSSLEAFCSHSHIPGSKL